MSSYRTLLPPVDPRRAAALRAQLRRLASALTPLWVPTGERDDFASALLAIAARLGEETTRRLDQTAERDPVAFFDFLGLPPSPPRAATGVLAMALVEGATLPVFAPARTQVTVAVAGGGQVPFETRGGLRVVPGRLAELIGADPAADRIEQAPSQVTATAAPDPAPGSYAVVSPAGAGSQTVQLSPAVGLAAGDVLRIGAAAYRIATVDKNTGIVTLLDSLEAPVAAAATVRRIASFPSFDLRNLQRHAFYVGHSALFDLKQAAEISLAVAPPYLARELTGLAVTYSMWGTKEGDQEPAWHPLELRGTTGGTLNLVKPDAGTVDKVKVDGREGRWLRAELNGPVSRLRSLSSPVAEIRVAVASLGQADEDPAEGSRTIARAFHNGTPLSTAGRFLPFGSEPLRFDAFALAAPEALSKKGATATIDITMVDSSLATFEIAAVADPATVHGYGVGRNGDLQELTFRPDGTLRWQVLQAADSDGNRLLLANAGAVETTTPGIDLVVATTRDGKLYTARIHRSGDQGVPTAEGTWRKLPDPPTPSAGQPPNGRPPGPVLVPAPPGSGVAALLFTVAGNAIHALKVTDDGTAIGTTWQRIDGSGAPTLTGTWQLTPVQGPDWPKRPDRAELVAIDPTGAVWLASIAPAAPAAQLAATWKPLAGDGSAAGDTAPAATRFRSTDSADTSERLWVAYATTGRKLHGVLLAGTDAPVSVSGDSLAATVRSMTTLHANPGLLGVDGRPVTVALSAGGAIIWPDADDLTTIPPPTGGTPTERPMLLRAGKDQAEVILGGTNERIFRAPLASDAVGYELHDIVAPVTQKLPHWVEIGSPAFLVKLGKDIRRFVDGHLRIYQIDKPALQPGTALTFLRYVRPTAYYGSFPDPAKRAELQLDAADTDTAPTSRLIIAGAAYVVQSLDGRIAGLSAPVAGNAATPAYRTAAIQATGTVQPDELGTLAELDTTDTVDTLDFESPAGLVRQRAKRQTKANSTVWVQLTDAWATRPAATGTVVLPGTVAAGATWTENTLERGYQSPELSWEYYDGEGWRRIEQGFVDGTANLSSTGKVSFTVPDDLAPTEIGGKTDYWIRARLIGGDYGRPSCNVRTSDGVQSVTVDTSRMHPPEVLAIEARFILADTLAPEVLLVENNLDVRDQTQAAVVPEARFDLFQGAVAVTGERALFLGLTGPVGVGSMSLLVDAVDQEGTGTVNVDLRTADGWHAVGVDDRTAALRRRGMVTLSIDVDPVTVRLFGRERIWLRFRTGTAAWAPEVRGVYLNTVEVSQARTVENEILGSSLGGPGLTVALAAAPVLPDTVQLRVRELLSDEELVTLQAGYDGPEPIVVTDPEKFPGSWVLWQRVDGLLGQAADARVYLLDPGSGRVMFGDGRSGKIPPAGRDGIRAFAYQQGGGAAGNVAAWSDAKLTSAVEGVDAVVLPVDAAGGVGGTDAAQVDQAARDSLLATAPDLLRHAGRALTPADVEALAVASAADVVRAHCAPPPGPRTPITVTLSVRDGTRRPVPTLSRREAVAALLRATGWGGLGPDAIVVKAPTYVGVAVAVQLTAPRAVLADVEQSAKAVLTRLFHPVEGGPDGTGWPFGRPATRSDVLRALGTVHGLDRVVSVELTPTDPRPPADGQVTAEPADVTVLVTAVEEAS
ncbi:hypothetical protein [Actinopolymorpha rutila]|uniref:Baseplate assembly protein n=1 Tax=Actinopolymorpha rutila TaxID=446787 RepID=A0A852ZKM1_9ACTN|nr:hypothetical protein [Actinopolymorpha rutila]NYH92448.1 hypothetical protein [Actinopolymorpha rutila]